VGEDIENSTALHIAAFYRSVNVAGKLIEHGTDIEAMDNFDNRPLVYTGVKHSLNVARLLIEHGANADVIDPRLRDDYKDA
jgi:ankyrin repeat protein